MENHILAYSFFLALLLTFCSAVSLDGIQTEEDPADTVIDDAAATLEELERDTFDEIVDAELGRPRSTMSPKKCCKIGKKVAEKGLYCNIDLMQVQKKNNGVFKRKMKWQGPEEAGKLQYKDLLMRVEKCYPRKSSRSMFMKCCQWQEAKQEELENCKKLKSRDERKACRQHVKGRQ